MPVLVTVPTRDLTYVTCRSVRTTSLLILFFLLTRLCCIDSGGRGRAFLLLLSAKSSVLLLFLLVGLLGGLSLMLKSRCFRLLRFGPRLFRSRVFYRVVFGASPSRIGSVVTQTLLIYLFDVGGRLQVCLSLDIDRFLYDFGPTV